MSESITYNAEDGKWYIPGKPLIPGVEASTYSEAFQLLYQHPPVLPTMKRTPVRESLLQF